MYFAWQKQMVVWASTASNAPGEVWEPGAADAAAGAHDCGPRCFTGAGGSKSLQAVSKGESKQVMPGSRADGVLGMFCTKSSRRWTGTWHS